MLSTGIKYIGRQIIRMPEYRSSSSFKSAHSLDKLYPNSTPKPFQPPSDANGMFTGYVPVEDLDITYSHSSGPGGQNVNKTATKVDIRLNISSAKWINQDIKDKLFEKYKTKINKEGFLVVKSDRTRSQLINTADAMNKLRNILWKVAQPEPEMSEETAEVLRKRREKSNRLRLMEKRERSFTKTQRQTPCE